MGATEKLDQAIAWFKASDGKVSDERIAAEVEAAALEGNADAAKLAGVMAGAGFGRERDWDAALHWTRLAAERGHAGAQSELSLLDGGAQLDALTAARPTRLVIEDPRIGVCDQFIDAVLCKWLIERAAPLRAGTLVYDASAGRVQPKQTRTNTEATFTLLELDLPILLVRERIAATVGLPASHLERSGVFHYEVGQAFTQHADYLPPTQWAREIEVWGQRVLTFLIYLNDDFDGGETHFITLQKRLRGGVGDAVFFYNVDAAGAPEPRTLHEGAPPTRGEKWLFSQFIRAKPQMAG